MDKQLPTILRIHGDRIGEVNFSSNVAGTTFVRNSDKLLRFLKEKVPVSNVMIRLVREPDNAFDENAVRVDVSIVGSGKFGKIGYVPKERAQLLSYVLGCPDKYVVRVHHICFVGGDGDKKNIGVFFDYNIFTTEGVTSQNG